MKCLYCSNSSLEGQRVGYRTKQHSIEVAMNSIHSYNPLMHFLSDKHCGPRKRVAGKGGMVQSCNTVFESKGSIFCLGSAVKASLICLPAW